MALPVETEAALYPVSGARTKGYKTITTPSGPQQIYYEEYGNPEGEPVFVLHGGPGYGISDFYARYFNPEFYHIIIFDQRGAKRSTPSGLDWEALKHITAKEMMEDINRLAEQGFGVNFAKGDKIHLMGGSWGSILGLYYGAHYPERLYSLTARATTLGVYDVLDKMHGLEADGVTPRLKSAVPEALWKTCEPEWNNFIAFAQKHAPGAKSPFDAYHTLLTAKETPQQLRQDAAKRWILFEHVIGDSSQSPAEIEKEVDAMGADHQISYARIETNWLHNLRDGTKGYFGKKDDPQYNFFDDPKGIHRSAEEVEPPARTSAGRLRKAVRSFFEKPWDALARIPQLWFIQGTDDPICLPSDTVLAEKEIHKAMLKRGMTPDQIANALHVHWAEGSRHMITEPGITQGLRTASDAIMNWREEEKLIARTDQSAPGILGH